MNSNTEGGRKNSVNEIGALMELMTREIPQGLKLTVTSALDGSPRIKLHDPLHNETEYFFVTPIGIMRSGQAQQVKGTSLLDATKSLEYDPSANLYRRVKTV